MILDASKYTKQQIMDEWVKCKNDPDYFICNYIQLESPGGNVLMKLYPPQRRVLKDMVIDHHIVTLKSRQTGMSTLTQAYLCWAITFYKNVVVGVISRDGSEATSFCKTVHTMLTNLPDWVKPKFTKCNEQSFITSHGCKFYVSQVNSSNPGKLFRGKAITIAVIDEAAFIERIEDAFSGFGPSLIKSQTTAKKNGVPFGTIIISTPNKTTGHGKWYYDTWAQSNAGDSIYKPVTIHWKEIPEYANDPNWYKTQCSILKNDPVLISQELEMKFLAGKNSFFSPEIIEKLNECIVKPIAKIRLHGYDLYQWEPPDPKKMYMIGVDTATSYGKDKSAIVVFDFVTFEQIAEYTGKLRVDDFCDVVEIVSKIYSRNLIVAESNSVGNQVVEYLTKKKAAFNIYTEKVKNTTVGANIKYKWGLTNTARTRPLMVNALYTYITENPACVRGQNTILELIALERKSGTDRIEASVGSYDDISMAIAFCAYVKMYDAPLSMNSAKNIEIADDIENIVDMNNDGSIFGALGADETGDNFKRNLSSYIKENLFKLSSNQGPIIDVGKLTGSYSLMKSSYTEVDLKKFR